VNVSHKVIVFLSPIAVIALLSKSVQLITHVRFMTIRPTQLPIKCDWMAPVNLAIKTGVVTIVFQTRSRADTRGRLRGAIDLSHLYCRRQVRF